MRKSSIILTVFSVLLPLAFAGSLAGCEAPGVGDPCDPEQIPQGGFNPSESYLETSSVQCRTRVCMVYELAGIPQRTNEECNPATELNCAGVAETEQRVYCTCRCDAPSTSTATLCDCPDGFSCQDVVVLEGAGDGIRGSYCVDNRTLM
ncbi:MAG: hypothetical protein AAGF12_28880 [Myxococcota bacterium]